MKSIFLTILMCLPAMAQRKLWTWTAPYAGDVDQIAAIHAKASDSRGNTALVIGEFKFDSEFPWSKDHQFRLLWISAAGAVLHESVVAVPNTAAQVMTTNETAERPWSVLVLSAKEFVVTDSRKIYSCKLVKNKAVLTTVDVAAGEKVLPVAELSAFAGWFQQKTGSTGFFSYEQTKTGSWATPDQISLWSLK